MTIVILLLSLLSPYFDASTQKEPLPEAVIFTQPSVVLAYRDNVPSAAYLDSFESLAGVALYTTQEELVLTKGEPLRIAPDPWQECLEYQYADMSAGVCGGVVLYVHVTPSQALQYGLDLNGVKLDSARNNLHELLGSPDFVAEDGDVYMRGNMALKIYRNMQTGVWEGIDLFDGNSS
ncbi:hypothetical protein J7E73_25825 [Paenibacillus albidus]|uniref:hypothetical protein n=1 Tax=Paenibacillus albidus TaxID=2041023 RepID=UPI001BEBA86B|nr:hypothetical protein [Paenibacillus albidus]MBT2292492.1 hypothetical protein [Paenibacillus albidus]